MTKIKNARRWAPKGAAPWFYAALALSVAGCVRWAIHPIVGPIMPDTAFCIAAALIEFYFGIAPACFVMVAGLGAAIYFFVPPYGQFDRLDQSDLALIVSYPAVTIFVICLIERLRRAQFQAELLGRVAQSRYEMLLRMDNERAIAIRCNDPTRRLIQHLAKYHRDIVLIKALDGRHGAPPKTDDASEHIPVTIVPGFLYKKLANEDARRLEAIVRDEAHHANLTTGKGPEMIVDCICERFNTHVGDFIVCRVEELA